MALLRADELSFYYILLSAFVIYQDLSRPIMRIMGREGLESEAYEGS